MTNTLGAARDNTNNTGSRKRPHSPAGGSASGAATNVVTRSSSRDTEDRQCIFCRKGQKEGLAFSRGFVDVLTEESVWASEQPFVFSGKQFWAHTVCVHFSPQTCYDNKNREWCNVNKEYNRSRSLTCTLCGTKGATIGCTWQKCNSSCHFPCAILDNRGIWAPSKNYSDAPFFCPNHECERAEYERSKEMTRLLDISQGRERVKIPLDLAVESTEAGRDPKDGVVLPQTCPSLECYVSSLPLPQGILLKHRGELEFKYVASVVDSESARVRCGPEREKRCCRCTGPNACRDVSKCECLRDGRNYRLKGRRLDDCHPPRVFECNLNCRCNTEQCRNRLVQKGIACQLVVAHMGRSSRVSPQSGEWGIKTDEDIPLGSFVCTVAGQLMLSSDVQGDGSNSMLVHRVQDWERLQLESQSLPQSDGKCDTEAGTSDEKMVVDQRRYANISRYIRRARNEYDSNLLRVAVYTANQDPRMPILALFTDRNIPKGTELLLSLARG